MTTTRTQLLGWLEHCEREHAGRGTIIPTWLCSMDAVHEAEIEGFVEKKGTQPLIPRWGMSSVIYGLTEKGRVELYARLPIASPGSV